MSMSLSLMKKRRFLPLFVTQFLNAFNDNFFKMAMVVLITYTILQGGEKEEAYYNAFAGAIFILPFFLLSAVSGQLADSIDKTRVIRMVKSAEIGIMIVGACGIWLHNVPLMFLALFAMGVHSTFFGPIKYGILPQHLHEEEVLGGTGLVEAGTYIAILSGTIVGGILPPYWSALGVIVVALIGRVAAQFVPPAPAEDDAPTSRIDWHIVRNSWRLVSNTMHVPRLFLAIMAISFFWAIGAVLAAQFPPMVKNALGGDNTVATLFTAIFSVGVAIGSVVINHILKGKVSAKYAPASVIVMGLFVLALWWAVKGWVPVADSPLDPDMLLNFKEFWALQQGDLILVALLGIAIAGGMFVVPLYAFLTTTVEKSETARTVAANNIVNSGAMVIGAVFYGLLATVGVSIADTLFLIAAACLVSAWISWKLHKACD
ncbi:MFS transporter [Sphingorhabdus sp.]|uniref:MFS transporter n=1 Tax=Sphingorhabdus sp. TaxID=1902408 RepID=UPI003BB04E00|nr:MFS transporter [Sphingomonadales bacterium]MBL0021236.1 MFS transporter [Sphingomonadales bacterium]